MFDPTAEAFCVCWSAGFAATETGQCLPSSAKVDSGNHQQQPSTASSPVVTGVRNCNDFLKYFFSN
jgi:hypothetical protein